MFTAVDCGSLDNPMNGAVDVPLTEFPGTATYTCNTGYLLSGGNTRTCLANGMWSGTAPTCTGKDRHTLTYFSVTSYSLLCDSSGISAIPCS